MRKGILSGAIFGTATGGAVITMLSLYAPLPGERAEERVEQAEPATQQVTPQAAAEAPAAAEPAATEMETQEAPAEDAAAEDAATEDAATEGAAAEDPKPEDTSDAPAPEAQVDAPQAAAVTAQTGAAATATPGSDPAVASSAAPALTGDEAEAAVTTQEAPTAPNGLTTTADAPAAPSQDGETPQPTTLTADAPVTGEASPSGLSLPQVDAKPDADTETAPRVVAAAEPDTVEPDTAAPKPGAAAQATPVSADTPIVLPVPKIDNPVAGVVTNRLPSVTAAEPSEAAAPTGDAATANAADVGALKAYAAPYEGTPAAGQFSVILIDSGADGMPRADLTKLEVPFSVAIDPSAPDAAEVAAQYRAAGIEVLAMLGDLPSSAGPSDVAVALEGYFGVLKEAIAVMDPLDGRIQSNRSLLQPVLGTIRDTGHGLVTYDRGLNTAQQAARREGIAAATVFRLLDADLEEAPKIKRYLNRAAFNASKDGSVVVVGRSYPETVKALLEWALDEKGADLEIVPVSQIMLQDLN